MDKNFITRVKEETNVHHRMGDLSDPHSYEFAKRFIGTGQTVIDVGGGQGSKLPELKKIVGKVGKVVNLDISDVALWRSYVNSKKSVMYEPEHLRDRGRIDHVQAYAPQMPIKESVADHVLCLNMLERGYLKPSSLKTLMRMVKPGGQLHISLDSSYYQRRSKDRPTKMPLNEKTIKKLMDKYGFLNYTIEPYLYGRELDNPVYFFSRMKGLEMQKTPTEPRLSKEYNEMLGMPTKYWLRIRKSPPNRSRTVKRIPRHTI